MRSSTARGVRFCASSTMSRQRLPCVTWIDEKASKAHQQLRLVQVLTSHTEGRPDHAQRVLGIELRGDDVAAITMLPRLRLSKAPQQVVGCLHRSRR